MQGLAYCGQTGQLQKTRQLLAQQDRANVDKRKQIESIQKCGHAIAYGGNIIQVQHNDAAPTFLAPA